MIKNNVIVGLLIAFLLGIFFIIYTRYLVINVNMTDEYLYQLTDYIEGNYVDNVKYDSGSIKYHTLRDKNKVVYNLKFISNKGLVVRVTYTGPEILEFMNFNRMLVTYKEK